MINAIKERNSAIANEIAELRNKITNAENEIEVRAASAEIRFLEAEKKINEARIMELAERSKNGFELVGGASASDMKEVANFRTALMATARSASSAADALPATPIYLQNEIVKKVETFGKMLGLVKKTTQNGHLTFARYEGKVTAAWIDDSTADANRQALADLGDVTLTAHMLRATVAYTELSELVAIAAWADLFATEAAKAIVMTLEAGIINGDGVKKITGIINDANVTKVSMTAEELANPDNIITLTADLDEAYQDGTLVMNYASFVSFKTLKDEAGHYVGFVSDNGSKHIYDKNVETVYGNVMKSIKAAEAGDVIMIYGDFNDYRLNFQQNIVVDRHFDYDKRQWVIDVVCYVDGKVVDPFSFIVVSKA